MCSVLIFSNYRVLKIQKKFNNTLSFNAYKLNFLIQTHFRKILHIVYLENLEARIIVIKKAGDQRSCSLHCHSDEKQIHM